MKKQIRKEQPMFETIQKLLNKPAPYTPHPCAFWDDEHISEEMLKSHLDAERNGATNNHAFVRRSADWIAKIAPPESFPHLLDLGCGPGIYAERFHENGYRVTGLDLSKRSIRYARRSARERQLDITYRPGNYFSMDDREAFDVITMINCDFGVFSGEQRAVMLQKIYRALKSGGRCIFDVFTAEKFKDFKEQKTWQFEASGFWSKEPHLCLNASYRYEREHTFLRQHVVVTESSIKGYYLWDHVFTPEELRDILDTAGFSAFELYGDISGMPCRSGGDIIAVHAKK